MENKQKLTLENDMNQTIIIPILQQLIQQEDKKIEQNTIGGNKTRRSKHKNKRIRKSMKRTKRRIRVKK